MDMMQVTFNDRGDQGRVGAPWVGSDWVGLVLLCYLPPKLLVTLFRTFKLKTSLKS